MDYLSFIVFHSINFCTLRYYPSDKNNVSAYNEELGNLLQNRSYIVKFKMKKKNGKSNILLYLLSAVRSKRSPRSLVGYKTTRIGEQGDVTA